MSRDYEIDVYDPKTKRLWFPARIVSKILSQYSGAVDLILHANVLREAAEASFAMEILWLLERASLIVGFLRGEVFPGEP